MKKGCLIALVIVGVLLAVAVWKIGSLVRKGIQFAQEIQVIVEDFQQQSDQLNQDYPFTEPAEVTFTDQQMQTFMAVRRQLNDTISTSPFLQKMKEFEQREESGSDPSISDIVELLSNITPSIKQVGSVFFDNLREQQISPDQYNYSSSIVISVLSRELDQGNFKEEISDDFSVNIRKMMLEAEQNNLEIFQVKQKILALEPENYNGILEIISPHIAEFGAIEESFYFDMFITGIFAEIQKQNTYQTDR